MSGFIHRTTELSIPVKGAWLTALLSHIPDAKALLVCYAAAPVARTDGREFVFAEAFRKAGYATLLLDGLTPYEEKRDPDARFDVPKLTERLSHVIEWAQHQPQLGRLGLAISANGTCGAAAIKAAAAIDPMPFALVCRAGRIDLAGATPLRRNRVPLLAIAGGSDDATREPAIQAYQLLESEKSWLDIERASERFIEPGTLDEAARAALQWTERWRPATLDLASNG